MLQGLFDDDGGGGDGECKLNILNKIHKFSIIYSLLSRNNEFKNKYRKTTSTTK
jgi:hypothetical protein